MVDPISEHIAPFRQNTLAELRWVAILGQLVAVCISYFVYHLQFNVLGVLIVIGLWALANLVQQAIFVNQKRLDERAALLILLVDLIELSIVLDLTGGLSNPFVVLMIVPAILSATSLSWRSNFFLIVATLLALCFLAWHPEKIAYQGERLYLPKILKTGVFFAMVVLLLFLSFFTRRISRENLNMTKALAASELALQREHRLSSLGALVAAYAHELGTPLATIRLTASDLLNSKLDGQSREDVEVILSEAKRSAEILQSMSAGKADDEYINRITLQMEIEEAAMPHIERGKEIEFSFGDPIWVERSEAVIQGLRNLIQNAVDFADEKVLVELELDEENVNLRISDDGKGFPPEVISKLGEPYLKNSNSQKRRDYEGMGLGVFIAKTLLERSGAVLQFANRYSLRGSGAMVLIRWKRQDIERSQLKSVRVEND